MPTPLLKTKLFIPPARPELVPRPRLIEHLQAGMDRRLTLVSAPAGCGKTTLLSDWATHIPQKRIAWLSMDESDNDLARFVSYLFAAVATVEPKIAKLQASAQAMQPPQAEARLTALLNEIAAMPQQMVLILDDYHTIKLQAIHDAMTFLLNYAPPRLHLVIATRADPPLPIARLRARGQLTEVRQSDLRFSAQEAAAFLNSIMGLKLATQDVAALEARTEGWIAGLQMAALAMQPLVAQARNRSAFVQAFTGSHRFVLDYLVEEVLQQQPPAIQQFLLKTSILDRLTGPLCDRVAGNQETGESDAIPDSLVSRFPDSQTVLEHLEAANLFIVPLDGERRWYRYHRLFADLLRQRLQRAHPGLAPELHRRASEWHQQNGFVGAAVDHALAAEDFERAADLIEETAEATLMRSEVTTFLHWTAALPEELIRANPSLCVFQAWALLLTGRSPDKIESRLQNMGDASSSTRSKAKVLRALAAMFQGQIAQAAALVQQALGCLAEDEALFRSVATWILSLSQLADGDLKTGSQTLDRLAKTAQEMGNLFVAVAAICSLARLRTRQGQLDTAKRLYLRALALATDGQEQRLPIAGEPLIGLGELERQWNNFEAATEYLLEAIERSRQWSETAALDAYIPLARIKQAQGDVDGARDALERARQLALLSESIELDDLAVDLVQATFLVALGDAEAAMSLLEERGLVNYALMAEAQESEDYVGFHMAKYARLALARVLLAQHRAGEALALMEPLVPKIEQLGRTDLLIEIQVLSALAFQALGQSTRALEALQQAFSLAEPGGHVRTFLDEGEPMRLLIYDFRFWIDDPAHPIDSQERNRLVHYADRLLAAFPSEAESDTSPIENRKSKIQNLVEPLSERELEVLRLLAAGLSNPEIADELVIAVSTVRSHCKSIYGKLGVHRRWDAVQRAQELGLV
jgi:LuxR family maltose regulon positive regulatory protein